MLGFVVGVLKWMQGFLELNKDQQHRFVYRPDQKLIVVHQCSDGDMVELVKSSL